MQEASCTCASDVRCPHDITVKFETEADNLERVIDRMLSRFDKTTLQEYIRDDGRDGLIRQHKLPKKLYGSKSALISVDDHRNDINLPNVAPIHLLTTPNRPKTADSLFHSHSRPTPDLKRKVTHLVDSYGNKKIKHAWQSKSSKISSPTIKSPYISDPKKFVGKHSRAPSIQKARAVPSPIVSSERCLSMEGNMEEDDLTSWSVQGGRTLVSELPSEAGIPVSLNHIIDTFIRKTLPWQAVLCCKAIESLREQRTTYINAVYDKFIQNMVNKLAEKVDEFVTSKCNEVDGWGTKELARWDAKQKSLKAEVSEFLSEDVKRQRERDCRHARAQGDRDLFLAREIERIEKESAQKQLLDAELLCNSEKRLDTRMLKVTISSAQTRAAAQETVLHRNVIKNKEAAHEWLRCVADNAVTASYIEDGMLRFLKTFRKDKKKVFEYLKSTREEYEKQCTDMIEKINEFCAGVTSQASDHVLRERLISRAFTTYLVDIHCRKEGLNPRQTQADAVYCQKRAERMERCTINRRLQMMAFFDEKRVELCGRIQKQFDDATDALLGNLRTRDAEVESYLTDINKTFRKYVQYSCNRRRHLLTTNVTKRKNFFRFEDECLSEMGSLVGNMRYEMDTAWRNEHLRALHISNASTERLNDLYDNFRTMLRTAYQNMSCNLEGDNSNVAWVADSELKLKMKDEERKFSVLQSRRMINQKWIGVLSRGIKEIIDVVEEVSNIPTPSATEVNDDEAWTTAYVRCSEECEAISKVFFDCHKQRKEKEMGILSTTYSSQRDYVDNTWKHNVMAMNSTLFKEVKLFFENYCEAKDRINEMNLRHEIEAYCYEQASIGRLDAFWEETEQRNEKFSEELRETLRNIIVRMDQSTHKFNHAFEPPGKSHFSVVESGAYDSLGDAYSRGTVYDVMKGKLNNENTFPSDERREHILSALQHDKIHVDKLFDDDKMKVGGSDNGKTDVIDNSVPEKMFTSVNDMLRHCIDSLQTSRVRLFFKHIKSELQTLEAKASIRTSLRVNTMLPVYNRKNQNTLPNTKSSSPVYATPINKACAIMRSTLDKLIMSGKLVDQIVDMFGFKRMVSQNQSDGNVFTDCVMADLYQAFSVSFSMNTMSHVAVCSQRIDNHQLYDYLRSNMKQLLLVSAHVVLLLASRIVDNFEDSPHEFAHMQGATFTLPSHIGLEDMLDCECTWALCALDVDEDHFDEHPDSGHTQVLMDPDKYASEKRFAGGTVNPENKSRHSKDKIINVFREFYSKQESRLMRTDDIRHETHQSMDENNTLSPINLHMSSEQAALKMQSAGLPDADICVLLSLLSDDSPCGENLFDMSAETLGRCFKIWRVTSYMSLYTSAMNSIDCATVKMDDSSALALGDYTTIESTLHKHDTYLRDMKSTTDNGEIKVACMSPFDAVGKLVRCLGSIDGLPLSFLQCECFSASGGGFLCDPWLTEPTFYIQGLRYSRLSGPIRDYILNGLLWGYEARAAHPALARAKCSQLTPKFDSKAYEDMLKLNEGSKNDPIPVELLRGYCVKSNSESQQTYTQMQLTMRFWAAFREDGIVVDDREKVTLVSSMSRSRKQSIMKDKCDDDDSPFPSELLASLPRQSDGEGPMTPLGKDTKSVVELLEVGDSVDSFTDMIGDISNPTSNFLSSNFEDSAGLVVEPIPVESRRDLLAASIEPEQPLHHPLKSVHCIWCMRSVRLKVDQINDMIVLSRESDESTEKEKAASSMKNMGITQAYFGAEHYPSLYELRRRIELSLLYQYCGEAYMNNNTDLLFVHYDSKGGAENGMSEYWKQLSVKRLSRMHMFTTTFRGFMFDHWNGLMHEFRKERHLYRVKAQQELFATFKKYMQAYKSETLRQRSALKELYDHIMSQMRIEESSDKAMCTDITHFYDYSTKLFVATLQFVLNGYKKSKIAYLQMNMGVYEKKKMLLSRVHERCRDAITTLCLRQTDSFRDSVIVYQRDNVRASAGAGYVRYQTFADAIAKLKNKFLTTISKAWRHINNEVIKSLDHFETLLGDLLVKWYDSEKECQEAAKSDNLLFSAEIKVSLDNVRSQFASDIKRVLGMYKKWESVIVSEIIESRVTEEGYVLRGGGDGMRAINSVDGSSMGEGGSTATDSVSAMQVSPRTRDSSNRFEIGNDPQRHSHLATIRSHLRKACSAAHKALHAEQKQLILFVKDNRKKRSTRQDELCAQADEIRKNWEIIQKDLLDMVSLFVLDTKVARADLSVELWAQSEKLRKVEKQRIESVRSRIRGDFLSSISRELLSYDNMDRKAYDSFETEIGLILRGAKMEMIDSMDLKPSPLKAFMRELKSQPYTILDTLKKYAAKFLKRYGPYESDDLVYQMIHTAERYSLCLDSVKNLCSNIVEEYHMDKRRTFRRIKEESNIDTAIGSRVQVTGVLNILVDTVVAEYEIKENILSEELQTQRRNHGLDLSINAFLNANKFPESFMTSAGEYPTEEDLHMFGPCKLVGEHEHHGMCAACVAGLYATISRNDVIVKAKLDAIYTHIAVLRAREDGVDRAAYLELYSKMDSAHASINKEAAGLKDELVASLKTACESRDEFCSTNSVYVEAARSIKNVEEIDIDDDTASRQKQRETADHNEVMAELLRRTGVSKRMLSMVSEHDGESGVSSSQNQSCSFLSHSFSTDDNTVPSLGSFGNLNYSFGNIISSPSKEVSKEQNDGHVSLPVVYSDSGADDTGSAEEKECIGVAPRFADEVDVRAISTSDTIVRTTAGGTSPVQETEAELHVVDITRSNSSFTDPTIARTDTLRTDMSFSRGNSETLDHTRTQPFPPGSDVVGTVEESCTEPVQLAMSDTACKLTVGDKVEGNFGGEGTWYPGIVVGRYDSKHGNEMETLYDVDYDGGLYSEKGVTASMLKPLAATEDVSSPIVKAQNCQNSDLAEKVMSEHVSATGGDDHKSMASDSTNGVQGWESVEYREEQWDHVSLKSLKSFGEIRNSHAKVPLLPLKYFVKEDEGVRLPYGWEERADDEGNIFYYNSITEDVSYDTHPSLFMANNWRKCFTDDGHEYYYNDATGATTWREPDDAYDDDEENCFLVTSPRPIMPVLDATQRSNGVRRTLRTNTSSLQYSIDVSERNTERTAGEDGNESFKSNISYDALYERTMSHGDLTTLKQSQSRYRTVSTDGNDGTTKENSGATSVHSNPNDSDVLNEGEKYGDENYGSGQYNRVIDRATSELVGVNIDCGPINSGEDSNIQNSDDILENDDTNNQDEYDIDHVVHIGSLHSSPEKPSQYRRPLAMKYAAKEDSNDGGDDDTERNLDDMPLAYKRGESDERNVNSSYKYRPPSGFKYISTNSYDGCEDTDTVDESQPRVSRNLSGAFTDESLEKKNNSLTASELIDRRKYFADSREDNQYSEIQAQDSELTNNDSFEGSGYDADNMSPDARKYATHGSESFPLDTAMIDSNGFPVHILPADDGDEKEDTLVPIEQAPVMPEPVSPIQIISDTDLTAVNESLIGPDYKVVALGSGGESAKSDTESIRDNQYESSRDPINSGTDPSRVWETFEGINYMSAALGSGGESIEAEEPYKYISSSDAANANVQYDQNDGIYEEAYNQQNQSGIVSAYDNAGNGDLEHSQADGTFADANAASANVQYDQNDGIYEEAYNQQNQSGVVSAYDNAGNGDLEHSQADGTFADANAASANVQYDQNDGIYEEAYNQQNQSGVVSAYDNAGNGDLEHSQADGTFADANAASANVQYGQNDGIYEEAYNQQNQSGVVSAYDNAGNGDLEHSQADGTFADANAASANVQYDQNDGIYEEAYNQQNQSGVVSAYDNAGNGDLEHSQADGTFADANAASANVQYGQNDGIYEEAYNQQNRAVGTHVDIRDISHNQQTQDGVLSVYDNAEATYKHHDQGDGTHADVSNRKGSSSGTYPNENAVEDIGVHSAMGYTPAEQVPTPSNDSILPEDWQRQFDDQGVPYYVNTTTGETSWDKPADRFWSVFFTQDGIPYYYNSLTKESKWTAPGDMGKQIADDFSSPADTPVQLIHKKRTNSANLSILVSDDRSRSGSEEEDPYMINLIDFTPTKNNSQKKRRGSSKKNSGKQTKFDSPL